MNKSASLFARCSLPKLCFGVVSDTDFDILRRTIIDRVIHIRFESKCQSFFIIKMG